MNDLRFPLPDLARLAMAVEAARHTVREAIDAAHDGADPPADAALPPGDGGAATLASLAAERRPPAFTPAAHREAESSAGSDEVTNAFEQQFADLASDKQAFDALMQQVYGDGYDRGLAEQYRQQALAGDFSWLPDVQYVDAEVLGGANGAYDAETGTVYINEELAASDPEAAAQTFVEEAGHHLDEMLNGTDSAGDEGELFRRLLGGEDLSRSEVDAIRAEDDTGTIVVDGREVEVEFWKPFEAIGDAAKAVGNAVGDAAKAVGDAVTDVAEGVWEGATDVAEGIRDTAIDVGMGVVEMTYGCAKNLVQGNFGEAAASVVRGFDRAVFQSVERFWVGSLYGVQSVVDGVTDALGPLGKPLREVTDRVFDIGYTYLDTSFTLFREGARMIPDTITGLIGDVERSFELAGEGRWGAAFGQLAKAGANVVMSPTQTIFDMGVTLGRGVASGVLTACFLEPPGRPLTDEEIAMLKETYGNSIDYGLIRIKPGGLFNNPNGSYVVGNTIYMPRDAFEADGDLKSGDLDYYLTHEVGHAWQNQNGGADYLFRALTAQLGATIGGDFWAAYDWQVQLAKGKTFETMNPEAQADAIDAMWRAAADGSIDTNDGLTSQEVEFLLDVQRKVKWGEGAG